MSEWVGRTLSKVEIEKSLGIGGMAEVYLGRHTTLKKPVAVKVLHAHLKSNEMLLSRFNSEAQAMASLRHPNIVQVLDYDIIDDRPYIVMELLPGLTLRDYLRSFFDQGKALDTNSLIKLINGVAAALDYAHARGIVHRDVKPANIMLRSEDEPIQLGEPLPESAEAVLTDFGVARLADQALQTTSGNIVGTPAYMSPEQVHGEGVDYRADIYALGVILYEMLAGTRPFEGDTQASTMIKHISEPVPSLPPHLSMLQPIVNIAMAKEKLDRYQKASDLARALRGMLLGETSPEMASPLSTGTYTPINLTPPVQAQKSSLPIPAIAAVVAVVLIGVGVVALQGGNAGTGSAAAVEGGQEETAPPEPTAADPSPEAPSAAADQPTAEPSPTPTPLPGFGTATINDGAFTARLENLASPPADSAYEAWLSNSQGDVLSMGVIEVSSSGEASIDYTVTFGQPILVRFESFFLSVEPVEDTNPAPSGEIVYQAELPPGSVEDFRTLARFSVERGRPYNEMLLDGLRYNMGIYEQHLSFLVQALRDGSAPAAREQAENMINLLVGAADPNYQDWNGSGLAVTPGDQAGLITYLRSLRVSLDGAVLAQPSQATTVENLQADIDALITQLEDVQAQAEDIAGAEELPADAAEQADALAEQSIRTGVEALVRGSQALPLSLYADVLEPGGTE